MNFKEINKKIINMIIIGIIIIVLISVGIDFEGFRQGFRKINLIYIPIVFLLIIFSYILRFLKFIYYLKISNINICLKDKLLIFLSAIPMTITPGKVGELLKAYLLKVKFNYPMSETTPIVIVERATDAIGMILLAAIGTLVFKFGTGVLAMTIVTIIIGIMIIQSKKSIYYIINCCKKLSIVKRYYDVIIKFYESIYDLLNPKRLIVPIIIGIGAWMIEGLIVYFVILSVGVKVSVFYSIFVLSISSIIGVISMIPGGIAASEGSILGLLINLGISSGSASVAMLLIRFATLWVGVIVGCAALIKVEKEWIINLKN